MQLPFRRNHPQPEPFWRRLDRAAGEINPFLLIIAVGLVFLYLTCVVGLLLKMQPPRIGDNAPAGPAAAQLATLTAPFAAS
jgi:hypothetical protein